MPRGSAFLEAILFFFRTVGKSGPNLYEDNTGGSLDHATFHVYP